MNSKTYKISLAILILAVMILGYGGLCQKKSKDDDTSSGSSFPFKSSLQQAVLPIPADGAFDVIIPIQLSWSPVISATSYDIYFSVTTTGWTPIINTTNTTYNPGTLSYDTIYYWRVDSKNSSETVIGNIWSFQTIPICWREIKAGGHHVLARKVNGTLWVWGNNFFSQLGIGDDINRNTPTQIATTAWSFISGGGGHSVAIKTDNTLWAWGGNFYGQLGDETNQNRSTPTQITTTNWTSVACGMSHTIALKTDGTIWSWGYNYFGQLGIGSTIDKNIPTQITTTTWSSIAAGSHNSMAIKTDGTFWVWGSNNSGQLGIGNTIDRSTPTQITATAWSSTAAGLGHMVILKTNGTIWTCGDNLYGQLGLGDTIDRNTPTQITTTTWSAIAVGWFHTIALKNDCTLWAWGNNDTSQLGLGDSGIGTDRNTPTQVGTDSNWAIITSGTATIGFGNIRNHTVALKTNRSLWSWGNNQYGQLGLGDTIDRWTPTMIGQ